MPLSRRNFVRAWTTGLLTGVAGCVSGLTLDSSDAVVGAEITVYQPDSDFASDAPGFPEPPRIEFHPGAEQVVVVGSLVVGSSSCDEAILEAAEYDRNEDTLRITVGNGPRDDAGNECTGDESVDAYRVTVTFEGAYPGTVVATEAGSEGRRSTTAHFETTGE